MLPLNLPAREVLRLPGATAIPWAVFDADWYRAAHGAATAHLAGASAEAVLAYYFDTGQGLGHSPNMLFDEAWHRRAYPGIAALVEAGQFPSAFDAWCRGGCQERSPHWLFDEQEYRRRNPDLTDALLARNGLVNGYDHYLWRGNAEGRIAHPLFDPAVYRSGLDPAEAEAAAADGPFWHCLRRLHRRETEVRTSPRFDPVWYLERYPEVRQAIADGTWRWAIEHYSCNATPTAFDPSPEFSEAWYLARHADAADMARHGHIRNGYAHFLRHGVAEGRALSDAADLGEYAAREDVRRDLAQGLAEDAFVHWLTIGRQAGLTPPPPPPRPSAPIGESEAETLFHRRARAMAVMHARAKLDFTPSGTAALSAILVPRDRFDRTMLTLGSLRANYPGDIDLVLIDRGSADATRDIQRYVLGATHFRFDTDIGLLPARDTALQFATADIVLWLDDGVELAPGAIAAAWRRLHADPRIGAVGGMILRPDGLVEEAGGIVWRDASTSAYGHGLSPLAPEVNFVRDVAFCSGTFLLARRAVLSEPHGFDARFVSDRLAAADLGLRMRAAGYRVVYDPAIAAYHGGANDRAPEEANARAQELFTETHADDLATRPPREAASEVFARMADTTRKRVLFIEDTVPLRMIGSGFVRSNDIVRTMASMGYMVTVYPINGSGFEVAGVYADMPDDVEVLYDRTLEGFPEFLILRRGYYDVVWVARTHNIGTVRAMIEQVHGETGDAPPVVLDTEAIESVREAQQAALAGSAFDLDAAIRRELRDGPFCRTVVAINTAEAAMARRAGVGDVAVLGHLRTPRPTPRPFAQRSGMLFVGAIHRMDSPNYDSLCWFIDEVLPLISRELTWQTRLTVVGYTGEGVALDRFREHPRVTLRGTVADLVPLYDSHRVFIAPTRIAAGVPYKVHEAASFGLPVVATDLLRRQLGWSDGRDLLAVEATDPAGFAGRVVALQRDEALWQRLRDGALERLRQENNPADYEAALGAVLGPPGRAGA
jgi:GT2 family glycosyltransferase/glycosyltransferase involved in cell wall biosynthesis